MKNLNIIRRTLKLLWT